MDPAAEYSHLQRQFFRSESAQEFQEQRYHSPTIDIKDLIDLDAVMDELGFGPNGGLIYALEYLVENMDWCVCVCLMAN